MKEWCIEHPWMTFFIILALLDLLAAAVTSRA
jgi:hypothetical protein